MKIRRIREMKISDRAIRAMPYETRLKHYEKEKAELFYQIKDMTASEVAEKHAALAKKWKV